MKQILITFILLFDYICHHYHSMVDLAVVMASSSSLAVGRKGLPSSLNLTTCACELFTTEFNKVTVDPSQTTEKVTKTYRMVTK